MTAGMIESEFQKSASECSLDGEWAHPEFKYPRAVI